MRVVGVPPSGGMKPTTPTIGTASDGGTGTTVSVAFTPSTYIGKSTITYTATSSPGSDRKSTRLNSSHIPLSRMPSSA